MREKSPVAAARISVGVMSTRSAIRSKTSPKGLDCFNLRAKNPSSPSVAHPIVSKMPAIMVCPDPPRLNSQAMTIARIIRSVVIPLGMLKFHASA